MRTGNFGVNANRNSHQQIERVIGMTKNDKRVIRVKRVKFDEFLISREKEWE